MDPQRLRSIPLFASISDEGLETIAFLANETSVPAGTPLVRQGDYAFELTVIDEGEAIVQRDGQRLASLGPGDVFGEAALLHQDLRNADVIALTGMRLITLNSFDLPRVSGEVLHQLRQLAATRPAVVPAS